MKRYFGHKSHASKNSIPEVQIKSLPKDGLNLRGFAPIGRGRSRIEFHELNFTRGLAAAARALRHWQGCAHQGGILTHSDLNHVI